MATIYQIGAAQPVAQVDTITIAGTPASGDTVWVECDNQRVTMTAGSTMDTAAEFAAGLVEALKASQHDPQYFDSDMTINAGGYEHAQFRDMKFSASAGVVTVEGVTPGWPYTITVGDTGTTTATLASVTAATGPEHFDNADNYSTGSVPSADDVIVFDERSSNVYHALNNTTADLSIERRNSYRGNIGLPLVNTRHGTHTYPEYRKTHLDLPITVTTGDQAHVIGERDSQLTAEGHTFLDFGTVTGQNKTLQVFDAAATAADGGPTVDIKGGLGFDIEHEGGSLTIGRDLAANPTTMASVKVSKQANRTASPVLTLKGGASVTTATDPIYIDTGVVFLNTSGSGPTIHQSGGVLVQDKNVNILHVRAGAVTRHLAGNVNALYVYRDGEFDSSSGDAAAVLAAVTLYDGFTFRDSGRNTYTTGIDFVGCTPASGTFDVSPHLTWTPSAI